tara:strand:+ start:610 stop:732 length:123 start_codon:yes stop_codon:yes gene_type:complete
LGEEQAAFEVLREPPGVVSRILPADAVTLSEVERFTYDKP